MMSLVFEAHLHFFSLVKTMFILCIHEDAILSSRSFVNTILMQDKSKGSKTKHWILGNILNYRKFYILVMFIVIL